MKEESKESSSNEEAAREATAEDRAEHVTDFLGPESKATPTPAALEQVTEALPTETA